MMVSIRSYEEMIVSIGSHEEIMGDDDLQ